jgi:pumilio family protein 6
LVEILHTKEGSKVAMLCLAHGSAKDRKVIIKSFKPYIMKIAKEQFGHLVLLAAFDTVDDTVLLRDNIISVTHLKKLYHSLLTHRTGYT